MLPAAPNCRCYLAPQETTMIPVLSVARREHDDKLFAIVNTQDVPAGVDHSFTYDNNKGGLVQDYPSFTGFLVDNDEWPRQHKDAVVRQLTWVALADICPMKVLHVTEYEGHIACVVDTMTVPRGVTRSRARWIPYGSFINEVHPATAKDSLTQGPSDGVFGTGFCWVFLDSLFEDQPAPKDEPEFVTHRGMNGDVVRVRNRNFDKPVSCGYTVPEPKPELIDGLTREECFRRYAEAQTTERMREDSTGRRGTLLNTWVSDLALTKAQLEAAREVWSERLREKTEAAAAAAKAADDAVIGWDPYGDEP